MDFQVTDIASACNTKQTSSSSDSRFASEVFGPLAGVGAYARKSNRVATSARESPFNRSAGSRKLITDPGQFGLEGCRMSVHRVIALRPEADSIPGPRGRTRPRARPAHATKRDLDLSGNVGPSCGRWFRSDVAALPSRGGRAGCNHANATLAFEPRLVQGLVSVVVHPGKISVRSM